MKEINNFDLYKRANYVPQLSIEEANKIFGFSDFSPLVDKNLQYNYTIDLNEVDYDTQAKIMKLYNNAIKKKIRLREKENIAISKQLKLNKRK